MTDQPKKPVDPQDPLPEASWVWRRVFSFAIAAAVLLVLAGCGYVAYRIVGGIVGKIDTMDARNTAQIAVAALHTIEQMFRLMFWALIVIVTYYMVAPSAEQITKMIQTAGLLKSGVKFASTTATKESPTGETTTATAASAGQDPIPPVPPPPVAVEPVSEELPEYAR